MREFWLCRHQPTVHLLAFEHMKQDLRRELPGIARFMGVQASRPVLDKVVKLSSLDWMMEHEGKFNEGWFREQQMRFGRYDNVPLPSVAKVTFGHNLEPSEETVQLLQRQWATHIGATINVPDYESMLHTLAQERQLAPAAAADLPGTAFPPATNDTTDPSPVAPGTVVDV